MGAVALRTKIHGKITPSDINTARQRAVGVGCVVVSAGRRGGAPAEAPERMSSPAPVLYIA